ncbi:hypothetical protein [Streptomyces leeuwenhoekii]|uniref:Uncharacterized protein n=1 Tax=Streptomyces leeuwenhoekii TaxID=1437453 RepID=A0A0F7VMX7_STRLW|nr:hypothetical protein [Streptomyces leeuwenhoekii]CQR59538.1 Hypothetical Protein sle_00760 [Streptomyces leeuwenhoekii]
MCEYDEEAAGEALRKAAELLPDDGTGDGAEAAQQAVQEALQALPGTPEPGWTPEQEKQIQAMVHERAGLLRRRRQEQARKRYVGLAMYSDPQLVDEAELRMWKQNMTVAILLEFAVSDMRPDDVQSAVTRLEIVHAATYADLTEFKQKMADGEQGNPSGP